MMQMKIYALYDPINKCFWEKRLTYRRRKSMWKRKGDAKCALRLVPSGHISNGLVPKILHIYELDFSDKDNLKSCVVEIIPDVYRYIETGDL